MKQTILSFLFALLPLVASAYDFEVDGIKYSILSREKLTVSVSADNNTCSGDIVIPSTVIYGAYKFNITEIADYFLFNNSNVTSITIQEGVRKIGNCAIFNQSYRSIDYISYPNSLDTLVFQAVGGCYNPRKIYIKDIKHWCEDVVLTSPYYSHPLGRGYLDTSGDNYGFLYIDGILNRNLLIPNNVDHINDGIFNESNIDTLTISSSVKKIGYLAFGESTVKCVQFSIGLDSIASRAFYNTRLKDIVLPSGLKYIGESAFYGCKKAQYIQINNEISEIEQSAFRGCSSAQKLVLGNGIKRIRSNAFADCGQLQQVMSKSLTPPDIEADAFSAGTYLFATLYVPVGTKSLYEAATGWKDFGSIIETDNLDNLDTYYSFIVSTTVGGKVSVLGCTLTNTSMSVSVKEGKDVTLSFTPDNGYKVSNVTVNGEDKTAEVVDGQLTLNNVTEDFTVSVSFNVAGDNATVTIGDECIVTFCPIGDVDFTSVSGVKAYIGSIFNRETGALTMTRAYDVPAGTGLLVKGEPGTYEIPYKPSQSIVSNLLKGVTTETNLAATTGGYANYVLASGTNGTGFYRVPADGTTLAAGRAYLSIPAEIAASRSALRLAFDDEDEATGISASLTNSEERIENSAVYDLQGRRVEQPQPGLYIRNGKKVVIK